MHKRHEVSCVITDHQYDYLYHEYIYKFGAIDLHLYNAPTKAAQLDESSPDKQLVSVKLLS